MIPFPDYQRGRFLLGHLLRVRLRRHGAGLHLRHVVLDIPQEESAFLRANDWLRANGPISSGNAGVRVADHCHL